MIHLSVALPAYLFSFFRSRHDLGLEILALRQQLAVLKRRHPRPRLKRRDRMFWAVLCRLWGRWSDALIIVKPETVVRWHRAGFRLYWRWRSRVPWLGRRKIEPNVFELVKRMARENPRPSCLMVRAPGGILGVLRRCCSSNQLLVSVLIYCIKRPARG